MTERAGQYIQMDSGVELFIQDIGSGEPILFIPGWTFTGEVFEHQLAHYSKTNRVIAVDPRSQGKSSIALHGNNYVTHGSDIGKLIKALQLDKVTMVGWSFGCLAVWEYIRQYGLDKVKAVVQIDLSPKPLSTNHEEDWVEGPLDDIAGAYSLYTQDAARQREFVEAYVTGVMIQREVEPQELNWLVSQSMNTPHYIAANLFASGMFSDYREEAKLASEAVPTLAIAAEHWGDTAKAFMNRIAPNTEVVIFGGHLMFWEHAEKFNQTLDQFLKVDRLIS
ncbi:alpha/beta fold hydrolase [Paenibacillus sp. GXUN7292]|uniref:alpha/beta fold hydrolase n=1 Tax=Paenibacillus sp. GXUN7292 TaxID=3422499 RepID=UPI003D7CCB76